MKPRDAPELVFLSVVFSGCGAGTERVTSKREETKEVLGGAWGSLRRLQVRTVGYDRLFGTFGVPLLAGDAVPTGSGVDGDVAWAIAG